jgi:vitamin-K-epoxide reductase (warfarin-sensitive)
MVTSIAVLSLIGFSVSCYAYIVEERMKRDSSYKPVCDLSDRVSCSKPFLSPYGKLIGFSNSIAGIAFYGALFMLNTLGFNVLVFYSVVAACIASLGLAYILYFKVQSLCLICISTYVINALLLVVSFMSL